MLYHECARSSCSYVSVPSSGRTRAANIAAAGFTWVRSVAFHTAATRRWIDACHVHNVRVLLVVARESLNGPGGIESAWDYADYNADAWQIGNEADHLSASSWTLGGEQLSDLGRLWRAALPSATLVCAGMVSGHPEYLDGVDLAPFDAIAVHPYGRHPVGFRDWGFGPVRDLVGQYYRFNKPIWITEFCAPAQDFRSPGERADYYGGMALECNELYAAVFPFKYEDAGVPGFWMVGTAALAAVSAVAKAQVKVPKILPAQGGKVKGNMTPKERRESVDAKVATLGPGVVGTIYKYATKARSLHAFCDAGIIIAEPGVPGAYLLKDFP